MKNRKASSLTLIVGNVQNGNKSKLISEIILNRNKISDVSYEEPIEYYYKGSFNNS